MKSGVELAGAPRSISDGVGYLPPESNTLRQKNHANCQGVSISLITPRGTGGTPQENSPRPWSGAGVDRQSECRLPRRFQDLSCLEILVIMAGIRYIYYR